jgi:hypothetical protein
MAANKVTTNGHLLLRQSNAFDQATIASRKITKTTEIDWFSKLAYQQPNSVLNEYFRQEQSVEYKHNRQIEYSNGDGNPDYIEFEMIVKIPPMQEIRYVPALFQVLKQAWCQYFCALIFWYFFLYKGFLGFLV